MLTWHSNTGKKYLEGQGREKVLYFEQPRFRAHKDAEGMNVRLAAVETPRESEMEKAGAGLVEHSPRLRVVRRDALPLRLTFHIGDLYACLPVTEKALFILSRYFLLID